MATPRNKKCANCVKLAIHEARERDFWVESTCTNRRKYYQRRDKILEDKAVDYAVKTGKTLPQKFDLDDDGIYRAELAIYGKQPNKEGLINGGVNGIQLNIYQGKNLAFESHPLPTYGLLAADLEELIDRSMAQIEAKFGIRKLGKIIWKDTVPKELS